MIVVTAQEDEETVIAALQAGADDYIVKPPKPLELLTRVSSTLRRARPNALAILSRDFLLDKVWGKTADVDVRTVDTHMNRLRRKLALNVRGWRLAPVYGFGYRIDSQG